VRFIYSIFSTDRTPQYNAHQIGQVKSDIIGYYSKYEKMVVTMALNKSLYHPKKHNPISIIFKTLQ